MTRKRLAQVDPIEHEIVLALNPGAFIPDGACFSFVGELDEVVARIARLKDTDPGRAASLYESFLAGCHEKAEEVDDSSGSFGQFVGQLFCAWLEARQASGADPDETATRLLDWMDNDPYGFCYRIEGDLAQAFDKAGLSAFVKLVRARFDSAHDKTPKAANSYKDSPDCIRRRWGEVLRTLYAAQKDITAYVALAQDTGLTAQDCQTIASLLVGRRRPADALDWVERGINCDKQAPHGSMAGHDLAKLKREILIKLGRGDEALDAAWAEYCERPDKFTYDDLMKLKPKRCFERAGLAGEWQKTVSQVHVEHHRKIGFMSGFERLVGGMGPSDEPSFLERAKARWTAH